MALLGALQGALGGKEVAGGVEGLVVITAHLWAKHRASPSVPLSTQRWGHQGPSKACHIPGSHSQSVAWPGQEATLPRTPGWCPGTQTAPAALRTKAQPGQGGRHGTHRGSSRRWGPEKDKGSKDSRAQQAREHCPRELAVEAGLGWYTGQAGQQGLHCGRAVPSHPGWLMMPTLWVQQPALTG